MSALDLIRRVAAAREVAVLKLRLPGRQPSVVRARQEAMYLVRKHTRLSFPEIGRYFDRDHSTVVHGVQRVAAAAQRSEEYADELERIVAPVSFAAALAREAA